MGGKTSLTICFSWNVFTEFEHRNKSEIIIRHWSHSHSSPTSQISMKICCLHSTAEVRQQKSEPASTLFMRIIIIETTANDANFSPANFIFARRICIFISLESRVELRVEGAKQNPNQDQGRCKLFFWGKLSWGENKKLRFNDINGKLSSPYQFSDNFRETFWQLRSNCDVQKFKSQRNDVNYWN